MILFLVSLISYIIGSVPFGLVLVFIFLKKDITKEGSNNIGATNVLRTSGKLLAFFTLFLDTFKGFLITSICKYYNLEFWYIPGFFAVLGHIFPIWLKFKGGKGVATTLGYLLALNPYLFLISVAIWIFIAILFKYSSLAALIMFVLLPFFSFVLSLDIKITTLLIVLVILIVLKHKSNIIRIINKTETKINLKK